MAENGRLFGVVTLDGPVGSEALEKPRQEAIDYISGHIAELQENISLTRSMGPVGPATDISIDFLNGGAQTQVDELSSVLKGLGAADADAIKKADDFLAGEEEKKRTRIAEEEKALKGTFYDDEKYHAGQKTLTDLTPDLQRIKGSRGFSQTTITLLRTTIDAATTAVNNSTRGRHENAKVKHTSELAKATRARASLRAPQPNR